MYTPRLLKSLLFGVFLAPSSCIYDWSGPGGGATGGADAAADAAGDGAAGASTGGMAGSAGVAGGAGQAGIGGTAGAAGSGGAPGCGCGSGKYCLSDGNCGSGAVSCEDVWADGGDLKPACGCNGITYWNVGLAASAGVLVRHDGFCDSTASACGSSSSMCPPSTVCNLQVKDQMGCGLTPQGTCWQLPSMCPAVAASAMECGNLACESECELIKRGVRWYTDANCAP